MRCMTEPIRRELIGCGIPWEQITEIRLRAGTCSALTYDAHGQTRRKPLPALSLSEEDLRTVLCRLCAGAVHAYDEGLLRGYFSPQQLGGVRVGAAGRMLCTGGKPERLQTITSLCIRLPHNVRVSGAADRGLLALLRGQPTTDSAPVPSEDAAPQLCSTLFYAPPGCGKTTLLRCIIKTLCSAKTAESPFCAAVLDNGEELCNDGFFDCTVDRFCGYPRGLGMEIATRAFAPQVLICDEIGSDREAEEILRAQACGVPLIATAHADSMEMILRRPCFRRLYDHGVFSRYVRLYRTSSGFSFCCEAAV